MWTLLLRLKGPMQSWGTRSRFDDRDTEAEPSKSGVLGLLCAAAGIDRGDWESLEPLTRLKMGVRVDSAGVHRVDFQTAQLRRNSGKYDTAITRKHFLADASFVAGLGGSDEALLRRLHEALKDPYYPLCLGRKSCPPAEPVWLPKGLVEKDLVSALADLEAAPSEKTEGYAVVESGFGEGSLRRDVPIAAFSERRYGARYVKRISLEIKETVQ